MKTKERGSHDLYDEPGVVGSLGGVAPYAKAQKISIAQVKKEFEKSFAYRLHKQGRWRGEFLPVVVFDIDEQWVTDLIKVQTLAKQNKGYRYILVVTDAFFKYTWAQSIKKETGKVWLIVLPRYSKKYKEGNPRRYRQIQAKNFTTWRFKSCYKRNTIEIVLKETLDVTDRYRQRILQPDVLRAVTKETQSKLYRFLTAANTLK